ncbi:MAG: AraC family transcriptional regulator [Eubacteriales bacterium]|nr:AraC family transcriptional regulator [Eubacteriales bacterium]
MQIQIDKEQKEIKKHGSYEFPVLLSPEALSNFDTESFQWHWHTEIELTFVLDGMIEYQVNETLYHLKEGEGLFCNTNVLHAGHKGETKDCRYLSVTFHPRFLYGYGSSAMQRKYVNPILNNPRLSSIHFTNQEKWMQQVLEQLKKLQQLQQIQEAEDNRSEAQDSGTDALEMPDSKSNTLEIDAQISLLTIWKLIFENVNHERTEATEAGVTRDTERIRTIIAYIQQNYMDPISLEDLAEEIHLCRSESCRLFKRYMNETIFDYLMRFRIEKSLEFLRDRSLSITDVAEKVGFATPGYYSRMFRQLMGYTPRMYRKRE